MDHKASDKLDILERKALDLVGEALDSTTALDERARYAMKVLNLAAKNRQTATVRDGLKMHMLERIGSEEDVKRYVLSTQPEIKRLIGDTSE